MKYESVAKPERVVFVICAQAPALHPFCARQADSPATAGVSTPSLQQPASNHFLGLFPLIQHL